MTCQSYPPRGDGGPLRAMPRSKQVRATELVKESHCGALGPHMRTYMSADTILLLDAQANRFDRLKER